MPVAETRHLSPPGYRFLLIRETRAESTVTAKERDITGRITRCGWLEERGEENPGVAAAPTLRVEILPDEALRREGSFWSGRYELADVSIRVEEDTGVVFDGVLVAPPRWRYEEDDEALTLQFMGRLGSLWDENDVDLSEGDGGLKWGHATDDILPALLTRAQGPPLRVEYDDVRLKYQKPFWSHYGLPPVTNLPAAVTATALAWDTRRRVLYVGVGPLVLSFDPTARRWEAIARVHYRGLDPAARNCGWLVAQLEYDAETDRLYGLAASAEADVRERVSHLRIPFEIGF